MKNVTVSNIFELGIIENKKTSTEMSGCFSVCHSITWAGAFLPGVQHGVDARLESGHLEHLHAVW